MQLVFADASVGFALANAGEAQYPARTLDYAYGSSVVSVTTDGGRSWWETFLGELVVAVVPGPRNHLVAYVQQQLDPDRGLDAVTWQYVSRDGGRHWVYTHPRTA
jgi:hypothetical protein